jgi:RHS repeat-associated protein
VSLSGGLISRETLKVYTSMYNTDVSYTEAADATVTVSTRTNSVTVQFQSPVFSRYVKLHSTVHEMDEYGGSIAGSALLQVNADSVQVIALTGGRNEFYNYRADSNRTMMSILAASMVSYPYSYYARSDLIKVAGDTAYKYDENGNLVEKGKSFTENGDEVSIDPTGEYWRYEYDVLNRLSRVYRHDPDTSAVALVVEYGYDVNNLRIYRKAGANVTRYVFDTDGNRLEEHRPDGSDYYVWRNGRHLAKRTSGGGTYFYSTDNVGTTVLVTDSRSRQVWSGSATPFGDKVEESGSLAGSEDLKYTGKDYDPLTGLVYFNARWYDASTGRFITEDPARDGTNYYAYANNNPLAFTDPTGLVGERLAQGVMNLALRVAGARVERLSNLVNTDRLAEIYRAESQALDPTTRAMVDSTPTADIAAHLADVKVMTNVNQGVLKWFTSKFGLKLEPGTQALGVGNTIYDLSNTTTVLQGAGGTQDERRDAAILLGHEGVHVLQASAHGGIVAFNREYSDAGDDAVSSSPPEDRYYGNDFEEAAYSFGPQNRSADLELDAQYRGPGNRILERQGAWWNR